MSFDKSLNNVSISGFLCSWVHGYRMSGHIFKTGRMKMGVSWRHKHLSLVSRNAKAFLENTIMGHYLELCPFIFGKKRKRKWGEGINNRKEKMQGLCEIMAEGNFRLPR